MIEINDIEVIGLIKRGMIILLLILPYTGNADMIEKRDHLIGSCYLDENIFIREVKVKDNKHKQEPLLLVHGARVAGIGSFDLPVQGGSLAEDLAQARFDVYIIDLRGYGKSSRPKEMSRPASESKPLVRTPAAIDDLKCAVNQILKWTDSKKINILGWATGGHWAAAYAEQHSDSVNKLIIYNSLYGSVDDHKLLGKGSVFEDKLNPKQFNHSIGGYQLNTKESLFQAWDLSIPMVEKDLWRDPLVANAYAQEAMNSDPESFSHTPPQFRSPTGAMADSFELAIGQKQWQAKHLLMPILVIFSQNDFWSRKADALAIVNEAKQAHLVEIPDGTHFVHLDRAEKGRSLFVSSVVDFLNSDK